MRSFGMSMWRRISGSTPWPMLPQPSITRRPRKETCFIKGYSQRSGRERGRAFGVDHRPVAHLDDARPVEAVEGGAEAGAVGTELPNLDPIAPPHVLRQRKGAAH